MNQQTNKISPPNANALSQASFLMSGIAWQESLLQAYRNYMVVTQSIFIAVNVVLLNSQHTASTINEKLIFLIPFLIISTLGVATLRFLSSAIVERAKSVDWWQRRLLKHECCFSNSRHFSTFRIAKEHKFSHFDVEAHTLSPDDIERLLRIETPRARKVFGLFVPGFYFLWGVLIAITLVTFPWQNLFTTG